MLPNPEATPGREEAAPCASATSDPATLLFQNQPLRIIRNDGPPWLSFAATDICKALKLRIGDKVTPAKYTGFLDEADKGYANLPTPMGVQRCAIISADGVKALCAKRDRTIDWQLRAFVNREVKRVAPAKAPRRKPAPLAPGVIQPLNGLYIPFVIIDDLPHYRAGSVAKAIGLTIDELEDRAAPEHLRIASIPIGGSSYEEGSVLTPIGVWTLGLYEVRSMCAKVRSWVFRETKRLCPAAFDRTIHGAAAMMALRPDGDVPPRPDRFSGRQDEWQDLKMRPEYFNRPGRRSVLTHPGDVAALL